jgi:peroxiredoxin
MKFASGWVAMCFLLPCAAFASPTAAMRVQKTWEVKAAEWNLRLKSATTDEQRAKLMAEMPDAQASVSEMWRLIGAELDKEWTLEPAAWFVRTAAGIAKTGEDGVAVPAFVREIALVRGAVDQHHLKSPRLLPMCEALVASPDPHSMAILEKVAAENPDQKIQGVAALGCAILLKQLGDDPGIMQRRLAHLRKAIIQSADLAFGGSTVAEVAKDELYVINNLTKGREAPGLTGMDSAGRDLHLSDFRGKVVYLLFWGSTMQERDRVLRMVEETRRRFAGKPLEVVGVSVDPIATLRGMEADGSVPWRNFSDATGALAHRYRVASLPLVYVLDGEGKIRYSGMPGSFADLTCAALLGN